MEENHCINTSEAIPSPQSTEAQHQELKVAVWQVTNRRLIDRDDDTKLIKFYKQRKIVYKINIETNFIIIIIISSAVNVAS